MSVTPTRAEQRLQAMAAPADKSEWTETVVRLAEPFAQLSLPSGAWESSPLRLRFLHAGIRRDDARLLYFAAKTLLPLLCAGLAFLALRAVSQAYGMALLLYVLVGALIGCYVPNLVVGWAARKRQREIFEAFRTRPT